MPDRLHRRYQWLWHVLSLGILVLVLGIVLGDTRTVWGWRQAALVGLVSLQMAVYIKTAMFVYCVYAIPVAVFIEA